MVVSISLLLWTARILFVLPLVLSQNKEAARPVNLLVINDLDNEIGDKSVSNSLKSIQSKHPDYLGEIYTLQINQSDPQETLDRVCEMWDGILSDRPERVPDLVLDITTSGLGSDTILSFTSGLGIPTISAQYGQEGDLRYWRDLNSDQKAYLIQVMQPADLLPELVRETAKLANLTNAAIVFEDSFVMDHKYKSLLLNIPTRHVMVQAKPTRLELEEQISKLRNMDIVNFFVLGGEETISHALDAAESLQFTGRKYGWFALSLDDAEPKCSCKNVSVLMFKPKLQRPQDQLEELLNRGSLSKPIITSAFYHDLAKIAVEAMRSALKAGDWPLKLPAGFYTSCSGHTDNYTLPSRNLDLLSKLQYVTNPDNDVFQPIFAGFAWGTKNGEHRAVFQVSIGMDIISNGKLISSEEVGTWEAGVGNPLMVPKKEVVTNHTAITSYRVVTVTVSPFVMYDKETDTWSGYCIDLLDDIKRDLKFEYDIREVEDRVFGTLSENGSWSGVVRELKEKRADIGLGSMSVMAERENVIDFTVPYYDLVGITIMMLKPQSETSLFKFLTVLESEVWFCILSAYFFTSFLMWVFDKWSPYSYQNNREKYRDDEEKRVFTLKECLWFCMTSLTPQGGGEAPKNLSGRLVAATWWLFGFIIIASYTANLAAFLTVSRLDTPIESLEDLSKQYKVQYAPILGSDAYTYFQRMAKIEERFYEIWKEMSLNDSLSDVERAKLAVWDYPVSDKYTKMFQAMTEAGFPKNMDEALRRVRKVDSNTDFALIGDATAIKYLTTTNCDLIQVGEEFSRKPYALAVQQGSPLKDRINSAILVLLNTRRLEKLKEKWWQHLPGKKVCAKQSSQSDGISIENIGGVFIVIFVGIILACLTLAFEYWWYRYRGRNNNVASRDSKTRAMRNVKPIRFKLHPAPTHAFQNTPRLRPRF